jgi:hypothetical protein
MQSAAFRLLARVKLTENGRSPISQPSTFLTLNLRSIRVKTGMAAANGFDVHPKVFIECDVGRDQSSRSRDHEISGGNGGFVENIRYFSCIKSSAIYKQFRKRS